MDASIYWQYTIISYAFTYHYTCGSSAKCYSFEFNSPINGIYCPEEHLLSQKSMFHECKLTCLVRRICAAFNYNHTAEDCTHIAVPCIKAIANPVMSFAKFTSGKEAAACYEWKPISFRAWDRAVSLHAPGGYVIRMLKSGKYYTGYYGRVHGECYASVGSGFFIHKHGYPCESLWVNEGCTVYAQKYTLGDKIPQRAVISGSWSNGLKIVVASVGNTPGYYVERAAEAVGPFFRSTEFTVLVVL